MNNLDDKELYYMLIKDLITRNSQLIFNERFKDLKYMNGSEGVVYKLNSDVVVQDKKYSDIPGSYIHKHIHI